MRSALLLSVFLCVTSCTQQENTQPIPSNSVWAMDLVETLPGQQDNYIASIETNWANARRIAQERGSVRSYRAFVAPQDTARGWDVLLMTEYTDSTEWGNREAIFQAIFQSKEFVRVEPAAPSAEMRRFFRAGVTLRSFVDQ